MVEVEYDGTRFQLISPIGADPSGTYLPLAGGTLTGDLNMSAKAINEATHTEAAHATTSDIWTGGNTCLLSGSVVTFTDVADAPAVGAVRYVVANAAHVITDNSALEVDGNANYTCAVGDLLRFEAKTTSTFRVSVVAHGDGAGSGDAKTANPLSQFAATTSAQLAGVISNETGSGLLVFGTSPTLVTPALGTPSALVGTNISGTAASLTAGNVTTNANLTGHITSSGNAAVLGSFTSAQLKAALTNETGSGAAVFAESPTLVTPALGTPASGVATNLSGTAASLTAGTVTTNANLTGHITSTGNAAVLGSFTSAQLATALTNETGSGAACFATAPTIVGLTATGDITMSGKAVNGAVHTEAAHATTSDIWTGGNTCLLSGSVVTFTDVADAPQAGAIRFVVANAAHVITDNSALEVDGNANYTCAIGDVLMFTAKTTSTFRVNILSHGDTTGDYVPSAVAITGGTINGTTVGASTPAAGNFTSLDATGVASAATFEPDGDTSAGDNAAIGYTAAEGLILTGQGSTSDITLKNDADATVFTVPTGTDDILFPDSAKAMFGANSDLKIYHDGSDSYVDDAGTGVLKLRGSDFVTIERTDGSATSATFDTDGAVGLRYNNSTKLETTSSGVSITGEATATGFTGTLDGVLGGGTPAAATTTTLNATGVATMRSEIDESSAYTGQLVIDSVTKSAGHLARILFEHDDHGSASIASDYESAGNGNLIFSTRGGGDPTERMRIKGDGKVGINKAAPVTQVHIEGGGTSLPATTGTTPSAGTVLRIRPGNNAILDIGGNGTSGAWLQSYDQTGMQTEYPLLLNPNGGNVGIGTSTPLAKNHTLGAGTAVVASGSDGAAEAIIEGANIALTSSYGNLNVISNTAQAADTGGQIAFAGKSTDSSNVYATWGVIKGAKENATSANIASYLAFSTRANGGGNTEKLRITSAGNVGIGCTPESDSILELESGSPGPRLRLTNTTGGGKSYKIFSNNSGELAILGNGNDTRLIINDSGNTLAGADNALTLGGASNRWSEVFAGNGTINTSDAREKTKVRKFSDNEIAAAKDLSKEIGMFQWLEAVEKKGKDKAREHVGFTVQKAIEIMEGHNLDPMAYGFICYDEWEDKFIETEEDGKTKRTLEKKGGNRYAFRYDQLNLFIARGIEARLTALEAK